MSPLRLTVFVLVSASLSSVSSSFRVAESSSPLPLVVSTWDYPQAVTKAIGTLNSGHSALDAVENGINVCELTQCRGTVGFGGHPDETGETTLDAFIMDGVTHDTGSVSCLRRVKKAISVARKVLEHTKISMVAGELATQFAKQMGFPIESLSTDYSVKEWKQWRNNSCQPNFWKNVSPDPSSNCGPYKPITSRLSRETRRQEQPNEVSIENHDTIGMIAIDSKGDMAVGTSTNGLNHKIAGRVGDSPIPGSGGYVDNEVGAAAETGDGDVMMRFVPSYQAVESMRLGSSPEDAAKDAIRRIIKRYPSVQGAIIVANKTGHFAAACTGFDSFPFTVSTSAGDSKILNVTCIKSQNPSSA